MPNVILVPLDGSDKDVRAALFADAFAGLVNGRLHFIRVLETPATMISAGLALIDAVPASSARDRDGIERGFRVMEEQLSDATRRNASWEIVEAVDVALELLRRAEGAADLIVMASRGPGTLERAFFGSVADAVVRKATSPVVIVPPGTHYTAGQRVTIGKVLAPMDGSEVSRAALDALAKLVPPGLLEYLLLQIVPPERTGGYHLPDSVGLGVAASEVPGHSDAVHVKADLARTRLLEIAQRSQAHGHRVQVRVIDSGDPASAIIASMRSESVDLIAMATRAAGGVRRALHGSVATRVARESEVPVFLVAHAAGHAPASNGPA
ncbi:MAG TPA: universal stress protein [Gemmatimonadaceae bacterium]|nr:universal stress protein [Gemmatimonadaceae bacterium]